MAKDLSQSIFQLCKHQNLVSPKDGKTILGTGRFLRPCVQTVSQAVAVPNTPLLFELFSDQTTQNLKKWPEVVDIKGWHYPQKRWEEWVDNMAGKHGALWKKTGIFYAIVSSTYEIRCNKDLILGLVEFWCPETNTFVFPWGEATVTLEDVMVLGGFSTLGDSVKRPLDRKLMKIEERMNEKRLIIARNNSRKANHSGWIRHFMEDQDQTYEHIAFLSLWLTRYVFPSLADKVVAKQVFPIAIHLSSNSTMALAQAVLAGLYKTLTVLKHQAMSSPKEIAISGPLKLLQLWAFEHFPIILGSTIPNTLKPGEPRAARFHRLNSKINLQLVTSVLRLRDNFIWRPYIVDLKNWGIPSYYKENKFKTFGCDAPDEYLKSFARCLRSSELLGIDCKEEYSPQRVAMQFGYDQDLPAVFSANSRISFENAKFAVLPSSVEPCVSDRYSYWWTRLKSARRTALRGIKENVFGVKKPETSSTKVPTKAATEGCRSSHANEVNNPRTVSSQIIKKRASMSRVDSKVPTAMCSLKISDTFSQVYDDNNSPVESLASAAYYSEEDNIPLTERMKLVHAQRSKVTTGSARVQNGNVRKRKFAAFAGRSKAMTLPSYGGDAGREMNAGGGSKRKAIKGSLDDIGKEKKSKMAQGFSKNSNNGTFKNAFATTSGSIQKFGLEIEGRLRRLEKMVEDIAKK